MTGTTRTLVSLLAGLALSSLPAFSAASDLQSQLEQIIQSQVHYWNTSLSFAVGLDDPDGKAPPTIFAAAAGPNDRSLTPASSVTTESLYPVGSTDKAFTAAAVMRYAEQGLIKLDAPVYTYIDPFLARQKPPLPSLNEQFGGGDDGAAVNSVTTRELLSMRSGIKDYDDGALFQWTLENGRDEDYLPQKFLDTVNKSFEFPPGKGGLYSGTGFVMLGMLLASVQNRSTWDTLDQLAPLLSRSAPGGEVGSEGGWRLVLNETRFMGAGKCSRYTDPEVVHQYIYASRPYSAVRADAAVRRTMLLASASAAPSAASSSASSSSSSSSPSSLTAASAASCSGKKYPMTSLLGRAAASFAASSADECCAKVTAAGTATGAYWTYQDGANCTVWSQPYKGEHKTGFTSGQIDGPMDPTKFLDLQNFTCLNGWTMGNIALTPSDAVRFYSALAGGRIVSPDSLAQMRTFLPLTAGYNPPPGTPYGLGLLQQDQIFPLKGVTSFSKACIKPFCQCKAIVACYFNATGWGHPGLDWGSGMPWLAHVPSLNLSFAMAFNSYSGNNRTMTYDENHATETYREAFCLAFAAVVQHVLPGFADFNCAARY